MIEVTPRLVFLTVFLSGLSLFLWLDREKIERHYILFYRRTKRGLKFIDRVAKAAPRFWNVYGWTGVITGLVSVVGSTFLIGAVIFEMFKTQSTQNGPSLLLPGLVSQNQFQAGVSFIPVEYWVVSIAVLMFVHEMSHGIIARIEGFELNSVGWIVMGIFPGAFVEPKGENMLPGEEKNESSGPMWEGGSWTSRLKVLCAGSFANYLTAAVFLLLMAGSFSAVTNTQTSGYIGIQAYPVESGLNYSAVQGYPAYEAGMRNGTLYSIESQQIKTAEDLRNISDKIEPGQDVSIVASDGNFTVTAVENSFPVLKEQFAGYGGAFSWFISLLYTVGILNLMIGFFNMLPFKPLDGGLAMETLINRFLGEEYQKYLDNFSLLGWLILITTLVMAIVGF